VLYQVYPRSFADSNGDGVGDLPGITGRLGYLADLGVDAIWLSPFYTSPMVDFGYDVSDHTAVDPVFGTLADFDALLEAAHARGLRVLVDFVPNHTSDQHRWFRDSRASRDSPRRDWYVWADPGPDGGPPNNWLSTFPATGAAWTLDVATGQYYLAGVLRFWLDRGVDGFRIDAVHRLIKDPSLTDNPPPVAALRTALSPGAQLLRHIDQPGVHEVLRDLHAVVAGYGPDRVLLGEVGVADPTRWATYYGGGDELDLPLNFAFWSQPWSAAGFRQAVATTERVLPTGAWPVYALGNHDLSRLASLYNDGVNGAARARLAAMLLLTLRGTPLVYYGDEIGMTDVTVPPESTVDPDGRDPVRTPMQWDPGPAAGFSTAEPWLPVPAGARTINVAAEDHDSGSLLTLYRRLLSVRRDEPALTVGSYIALHTNGEVLAYRREHQGRRILVALNFGDQPAAIELPDAAGPDPAQHRPTPRDRRSCRPADPHCDRRAPHQRHHGQIGPMTQHYAHLGVYSDWVQAAPGPRTRATRPTADSVRRLVHDLLAVPVHAPGGDGERPADMRVERRWNADGLVGEELSYSVGYGPRTWAWLLKPADAAGPLPGVLALHGHDGFKYYGKEKIADGPKPTPPGPPPYAPATTRGGRSPTTSPAPGSSCSSPTCSVGAVAASRSPRCRP